MNKEEILQFPSTRHNHCSSTAEHAFSCAIREGVLFLSQWRGLCPVSTSLPFHNPHEALGKLTHSAAELRSTSSTDEREEEAIQDRCPSQFREGYDTCGGLGSTIQNDEAVLEKFCTTSSPVFD